MKKRILSSCLYLGVATLHLAVSGATPAYAQAVFVRTGGLSEGRYAHAAVLLQDGRVLALGGWGRHEHGYYLALSSSEIFDPATETWAPSGSLGEPRIGPGAVTLPSGKVLVVGGVGGLWALATAEIYDPQTGTYSGTGSMLQPRSAMTTTLLANGTVLVAGGMDQFFNILDTAEIYDPATGMFSAAGNMPQPLDNHSAALLPSGDVLIAGGCHYYGCPVIESLLYNPVTREFTVGSPLVVPRSHGTATSLDDGQVLVAGGDPSSGDLYDPITATFSFAGAMVEVYRSGFAATLLPTGRVLFSGGGGYYAPLASAELFSMGTGFTATAAMHTARVAHTATLLADGRVLVAGGIGYDFPLHDAELYYESGYNDIVSPVLNVPADITVAAVEPGGIAVDYAVTATDNADVNPLVTCTPASGTVFSVGTTTVNCVATDAANNVATASFLITVLPPLEISVAFETSLVNVITGQVTVVGTISCNRPVTGSVSGQLSQLIANRAVVTASFGTDIECGTDGMFRWTASADPAPDRFKAGKASVNAYVWACDSLTCDEEWPELRINFTAARK